MPAAVAMMTTESERCQESLSETEKVLHDMKSEVMLVTNLLK